MRKSPLLHGRKSTPTPKFLGTAKAYFVCHIGPNFQLSLIYAFIGCPSSTFLPPFGGFGASYIFLARQKHLTTLSTMGPNFLWSQKKIFTHIFIDIYDMSV